MTKKNIYAQRTDRIQVTEKAKQEPLLEEKKKKKEGGEVMEASVQYDSHETISLFFIEMRKKKEEVN